MFSNDQPRRPAKLRKSGMNAALATDPPLNSSEREHMPLLSELGGPCGTCGYKHGAPNGASRMAALTLRGAKAACRVRLPLPLCHFWLSLPTHLILPA